MAVRTLPKGPFLAVAVDNFIRELGGCGHVHSGQLPEELFWISSLRFEHQEALFKKCYKKLKEYEQRPQERREAIEKVLLEARKALEERISQKFLRAS